MIKATIKTLLLVVFFYFLTILQISYLPFFIPFDLMIILVILINVLEEPDSRLGIISAFLTGFFIDIYSSRAIGFTALIFLASSYLIKFILSKYVRIPSISWLPKI